VLVVLSYLAAVGAGLDEGINLLMSNVNMVLDILLMLVIVVAGPAGAKSPVSFKTPF
jgi:choline-glycine betaine transporter